MIMHIQLNVMLGAPVILDVLVKVILNEHDYYLQQMLMESILSTKFVPQHINILHTKYLLNFLFTRNHLIEQILVLETLPEHYYASLNKHKNISMLSICIFLRLLALLRCFKDSQSPFKRYSSHSLDIFWKLLRAIFEVRQYLEYFGAYTQLSCKINVDCTQRYSTRNMECYIYYWTYRRSFAGCYKAQYTAGNYLRNKQKLKK